MLLRLCLVAGAPVERAEPEVAVGGEGAHPELSGEGQRLAVVALAARGIELRDVSGHVASAVQKLDGAIAQCSSADLAALTSCATSPTAEEACVTAAADSATDEVFDAVYPP